MLDQSSQCQHCGSGLANSQSLILQTIWCLEDACATHQNLTKRRNATIADRKAFNRDAAVIGQNIRHALKSLFELHDLLYSQHLYGDDDSLPYSLSGANLGSSIRTLSSIRRPLLGYPTSLIDRLRAHSKTSNLQPFLNANPDANRVIGEFIAQKFAKSTEQKMKTRKDSKIEKPLPSEELQPYIPPTERLNLVDALKQIRQSFESRWESGACSFSEAVVQFLETCESNFYLVRDQTTDSIWNVEHQEHRKEVFAQSDVGLWCRQKCLCIKDDFHALDVYCPHNITFEVSDDEELEWDEELQDLRKKKTSTTSSSASSEADGDEAPYDPEADRLAKEKELAETIERIKTEINEMIGLENIKDHLVKVAARVETAKRQGTDIKEERFGTVFIGNSGTGKTAIARNYAKYLSALGVVGDGFTETSGVYLNDGGIHRTKIYITDLSTTGGVLFVDDAHHLLSYSGGRKVMDFMMQEMENQRGKVVFVLAGNEKGMFKVLGHGNGTSALLPYVLNFKDYSNDQLLELMGTYIKKKFDGKMEVEGGLDGLYMRVATRRVARDRDTPQFGNARAVDNMLARISERQSARLSKIRKEKEALKAAEEKLSEEKEVEETKEKAKSDELPPNSEEQKETEKPKEKVELDKSFEDKKESEETDETGKSENKHLNAEDNKEPEALKGKVNLDEQRPRSEEQNEPKLENKEALEEPQEKHNSDKQPDSEDKEPGESETKARSDEQQPDPEDKEPGESETKARSDEQQPDSKDKNEPEPTPKPETEGVTLANTTSPHKNAEIVVEQVAKVEKDEQTASVDKATVDPDLTTSTEEKSKADQVVEKTVEKTVEEIPDAKKDTGVAVEDQALGVQLPKVEVSENVTKASTDDPEKPSGDEKKSDEAEKSEDDKKEEDEKEEVDPADYFFTKEDILGPDPSEAILDSTAWRKIQSLVGLAEVKRSILNLFEVVKSNYQRELQEKPLLTLSLNRLFLGPPGTGKTVVATLYAQILAEIGALTKGEVILKNPSDLIGQYIGWTESQTKAALTAAMGNVLVIDEAHMMYSGSSEGTGNNSDRFRLALIDTIVAEVQGVPGEDRAVLLLGYEKEMQEMLQNSNPGLSRRFPLADAFRFENFTLPELESILRSKLEEHALEVTPEGIKIAMDVLDKARSRLNFGNGGEIENLISKAKSNHQGRISALPASDRSDSWILEPQDFDPEYDRGETATLNLQKLFSDVIGCEEIVRKLEMYQKVSQTMKARNMDPKGYIPTNFVFKGPPGTGKTTTARKVAQVYYDMGFLSEATVVECSASDLIGKYVGHTGPKTTKVLEKALGKVLFIDEAYRLASGTEGNSFTSEVVSELVDGLTKPKFQGNLIVILAGYENEMNNLLSINPGLASRFPNEIHFTCLSSTHCLQVLKMKLAQAGIAVPVLNQPKTMDFKNLVRLMNLLAGTHLWGNARDVETLAKTLTMLALGSATGEGELTCSAALLTSAMETMLQERRARVNNQVQQGLYI